jgi:small-conductance mechanosensitive channel
MDFLTKIYFGNTVEAYAWFFGTLVVSALLIQIVKRLLFKRIFGWASKKSKSAAGTLIPAIRRYLPLVLYVSVFYLSLETLQISDYFRKVFNLLTAAVAVYLIIILISAVMDFMLAHYKEKNIQDENRAMAFLWLSKTIKGVLWVIAVIFFLSNVGIEIGALVTGLGIGGVAVAFAAQAILEDVFSYFTIFVDRPFEIGDFITADDYMGTIENIGIRTTRVRSLSGEQLVFPNKDLTNSRIKNYKTMQERRVLFKLGVVYDTPLEILKQIPDMIKSIIESEEGTRFDRAHFFAYGDSSLNFEIVYYVLAADYTQYMNIQQSINFKIREVFDAHEIAFAFPSRTVYLDRVK